MRIRPYAVLGFATLCAGAALATVVINNDPYRADTTMLWLFWSALTLVIWGGMATLFSLAGHRLAQSLIAGIFWSTSLISLVFLLQSGITDRRLSAGIIGATIILTIVLWIRSRKSARQQLPN